MRAPRSLAACAAIGLLALSCLLTGCPYGPATGLPEHIQTVRVTTFRNNTEYVGVEGALTRAVIERMARDPRVDVVRQGEDAVLRGEIVKVQKRVVRQGQQDRPASVRLTISARITFEDRVSGQLIIDDRIFDSTSASSAAGVYDLERGESRSEAEARALDELAAEIVRAVAGL